MAVPAGPARTGGGHVTIDTVTELNRYIALALADHFSDRAVQVR